MRLEDVAVILDSYAIGHVNLDAVHRQLLPVLVADPLDVELIGSDVWDEAADESRLFWRLVYLFEAEVADSDHLRHDARRLVACFRQTGSADVSLELLPLVLDQDRFVAINDRHQKGIISRTGLLSFVAESGYPPHVKLWLEHAGEDALAQMSRNLAHESYAAVAAAFESPPA